MEASEISQIRSGNQQITGYTFSTAEQVARWMGAIQAQDYSMSKWAFGVRIPNSTEEEIDSEIDAGKIVRTHVLRPTWHFILAEDIYWINALSAPHIKVAMSYRDKQLELTEDILNRCNKILEKTLRDNNHKTREELINELKKENIRVDENRASHIFMRAEIEGIICSGRQKKGKITYALIPEWVPQNSNQMTREEALRELGKRYFTSRGPATIKDFSWWSGLSAGESRIALELNKSDLTSDIFDNQTYWFSDSVKKQVLNSPAVYFLPSYDEFLISYRDRSVVITTDDHKTAVSINGIFYPTILYNGKIAGLWKRKIKGDTITISTTLFENVIDKIEINDDSIVRYAHFLNKKTVVFQD